MRSDSSSAELSISDDEDGGGAASPVRQAKAEEDRLDEGGDGAEDDSDDEDDEDEEFLDYAVLQVPVGHVPARLQAGLGTEGITFRGIDPDARKSRGQLLLPTET